MHNDGHGSRFPDGVYQQGDHRDVIQVRMGDEDVIDLQEFVVLQVTHPGACIDQDVMVDQQRRGALVAPTNPATAPQNPHLHLVPMKFRKRGNWTACPDTEMKSNASATEYDPAETFGVRNITFRYRGLAIATIAGLPGRKIPS